VSTLRTVLRKVLLLDILQGLAVTLRLYFSKKATIPYPEKVKLPAPNFRGILRLNRNETGEPLCIACRACQRSCGTNCFDIEGERDEGTRRMRPMKFDWKLDRCSFCSLCVDICPTRAIRFSLEFRMTSVDKGRLLFHLPDMYLTGKDLQDFLGEGGRE
jgi:NADH-quinone oxidoreductase subunit I